MELAAAYIRVSEDKSDGNKVSPHVQLQEINKYIERNGWVNFKKEGYMDIRISGGNMTDRDAFLQLLNDVDRYSIKHIVFYDMTRYTRNIFDFTDMTRLLNAKKVKLHTVMNNRTIDLENWSNETMMDFILVLFGHNERETVRKKVSDAMEDLCRKGFSVGGPAPMGLRKIKVQTTEGLRTSFEFDDEEKVELIRSIYDWYIDGMSELAIVNKLNNEYAHLVDKEKAIKYRKDKYLDEVNADVKFNTNKVARILTQPLYTGYMVSKRRNRISKIKHVANPKEEWLWSDNFTNGLEPNFDVIIPYETWVQVQNIRVERNPKIKRKEVQPDGSVVQYLKSREVGEYEPAAAHSNYLLSSLVNCGYCGKRLAGRKKAKDENDKSKGYYYYYYCRTNSQHKGACSNSTGIRCEKIDNEVLRLFGNTINLHNVLLFIKRYQESQTNDGDNTLKQIYEIENEIKDLAFRQKNLLDRMSSSTSSSLTDQLFNMANELGTKIDVLKEEKNKLEESRDPAKERKVNMQELVTLMLQAPQYIQGSGTASNIRKILKGIISRVVYYGTGKVSIHLKFMKDEVRNKDRFKVVLLSPEEFAQKKLELQTANGNPSKRELNKQDELTLIKLFATMWDMRGELNKKEEELLDLMIGVLKEKLDIEEADNNIQLEPVLSEEQDQTSDKNFFYIKHFLSIPRHTVAPADTTA